MKKLNYLLVLWLFTISCTGSESLQVTPLRKVTGGEIEGTYDSQADLHIFKGIPFAAPPVGDLRWKAPQPVVPWEGRRAATEFGPSAMQPVPRPFMMWSSEFLIPEEPISEDCLYLNVWTAAEMENDKRPVLVYIHGGGFSSGGGACPIYDGTAMAKKDIVFVTINYRVGAFGFLAHPELSEESSTGTSGNYAVLDMIAALKWVQENITAFGGDPDNVTIAGQSAGSAAVNILAASPLASGLFHKAIGESGALFYLSPLRRMDVTPSRADSLGIVFAEEAGVSSLEGLRALPADSILSLGGGLRIPYPDGYVLPGSIHEIYGKGRQNDVPLLTGWNEEDIVMRTAMEEEIFREMVRSRFGDHSDAFYDAYAAETPEQITHVQTQLSRDETFGIQAYTWAKMQDSTGNASAYLYNFNRSLPAYTPQTQFGAFHSGEIVYAYDNLHTLDRPWEEVDHRIADQMSGYWANFALKGDPNGEGLPEWKPYSRENEYVLVIDTVTNTEILPDEQKMRFWENFYHAQNENE